MYRFIGKSDRIFAGKLTIDGTEARHMAKVLRLKPGAKIEVVDERQRVFSATIEVITEDSVKLSLESLSESVTEPPVAIFMGQAMLKGKKMDELIHRMVELGVVTWIPFFSRRSVPVFDETKMQKKCDRWKKIAKEAMKQCKRTRIPDIYIQNTLSETMEFAKNCEEKYIFWEKSTRLFEPESKSSSPKREKKIMIVTGPEGGFEKEEIEYAMSFGFVPVRLGPRILKAETAAIAACAILQHVFGDLK
jgi:16S rRNA (uracil1498-N3)-methyltransferase